MVDLKQKVNIFFTLCQRSVNFLKSCGSIDQIHQILFCTGFLWKVQKCGIFQGDRQHLITECVRLSGGRTSGIYTSLLQTYSQLVWSPPAAVQNLIRVKQGVRPIQTIIGEITNQKSQSNQNSPFNPYFQVILSDEHIFSLPLHETILNWEASKPDWNQIPENLPLFNLYEIYEKYAGELDDFTFGASYEKLLTEEQKHSSGSYYTPLHITKFICEQTIFPWLFPREEPAKYVDKPNRITDKSLSLLISRLDQLRIFDPAMGSGHFIIEAIRILLDLIEQAGKGHHLGTEISSPLGKIWNRIQFVSGEHKENALRFYILYEYILPFRIFGLDINTTAVLVAQWRILMLLFENLTVWLPSPEEIAPLSWNLSPGNSLTGEFPQKPGFDIILGNPPYGNLLSADEQTAVRSYASYPKEIAAVFIERMLDLQNPGGIMGLIVTYALTFSKDLSKTREKIARTYATCKVATFDRDHCRFFEGMTQSVSILFAYPKRQSKELESEQAPPLGQFYTTNMYRTMPALNKLEFQPTNAFLMNSGDFGIITGKHRLPKLGSAVIRTILTQLIASRSESGGKRVGDFCPRLTIAKKTDDPKSPDELWIRISGNYWYNAWDRPPYFGTQIAYCKITSPSWRDFLLILVNSSLFYTWFRIFSDGRHMNADIMQNFPLSAQVSQFVDQNADFLRYFATHLMKILFEHYDVKHQRFLSSEIKGFLDACDVCLAELYGFDSTNKDFILNFEAEIRGGKQIPRDNEAILQVLITKLNANKSSTSQKEIEQAVADIFKF